VTTDANYTAFLYGKNFDQHSSVNISIRATGYEKFVYFSNFSDILNDEVNFSVIFL